MFTSIKDLFGVAKDARSVISLVASEKQKARGTRNGIFAEAEFNMELILHHYVQKGVPPKVIIGKLKNENLTKALNEGFDFGTIKKGIITKELIRDVGFLTNFVGKNCEFLLRNISHHIEQLKLLPELYDPDKEKSVNVNSRILNLGKRYLLFTKFIKS